MISLIERWKCWRESRILVIKSSSRSSLIFGSAFRSSINKKIGNLVRHGVINRPFFYQHKGRNTFTVNGPRYRAILSNLSVARCRHYTLSLVSSKQINKKLMSLKQRNTRNYACKVWRLGHLAASVLQLAAAIIPLDTPRFEGAQGGFSSRRPNIRCIKKAINTFKYLYGFGGLGLIFKKY